MKSPSEIAQIHTAMTNAGGNRIDAAAALGIPLRDLDVAILENKDLSTLWGRIKEAPTTLDSYDRDRPSADSFDLVPEVVSPRAEAVADGFFRQEAKLQRYDWEGLGEQDEKTLALMRQFEGNGVGRGVLRMMDAMQGGMAFCFMKVSRQFSDVSDQLTAEQAKGAAAQDLNKVMLLHSRFMDLAREMQKFSNEANKAAQTRLLIAERAKKIQQGAKALRKPGWGRKAAPKEVANA
jgi:hypothetical protein